MERDEKVSSFLYLKADFYNRCKIDKWYALWGTHFILVFSCWLYIGHEIHHQTELIMGIHMSFRWNSVDSLVNCLLQGMMFGAWFAIPYHYLSYTCLLARHNWHVKPKKLQLPKMMWNRLALKLKLLSPKEKKKEKPLLWEKCKSKAIGMGISHMLEVQEAIGLFFTKKKKLWGGLTCLRLESIYQEGSISLVVQGLCL